MSEHVPLWAVVFLALCASLSCSRANAPENETKAEVMVPTNSVERQKAKEIGGISSDLSQFVPTCEPYPQNARLLTIPAHRLENVAVTSRDEARRILGGNRFAILTAEQAEHLQATRPGSAILVRGASYSAQSAERRISSDISVGFDAPSRTIVITTLSLGGTRPGEWLLLIYGLSDVSKIVTVCEGAL